MKPIAQYWKNVARDWHASSYQQHATERSIVEWAATFIRGHIRRRHVTAVRVLAPRVAGQTVLELGCGTGSLSLALLEREAARAIGIDISSDVVGVAEQRARDAGFGDRARFIVGLVEDADPAWRPDIIIGLGILEYLEPAAVEQLLQRLRPRDVLFAFDERRLTVLAALHAVYRRLRRLPFYQKYRDREILALLARAGYASARVFREDGNAFVTTLQAAGDRPR